MKFGVVNKSTILNRFVLHTLQRNITHLAVITRKSNIKLGILKRGGKLEKSLTLFFRYYVQTLEKEPSSREETIELGRRIDTLLNSRRAKHSGICAIRREIFSQLFDEVVCKRRGNGRTAYYSNRE